MLWIVGELDPRILEPEIVSDGWDQLEPNIFDEGISILRVREERFQQCSEGRHFDDSTIAYSLSD